MPGVLHEADLFRISHRILPRDVAAAIGGPVVDQHQFPRRKGLAQHAVDGFVEIGLPIEKDRHHGDRYIAACWFGFHGR